MCASNRRIAYLDLFAGAGGLSEGFRASGYESVAHVEMDIDACNTLKTRECFYYLQSTGNIEAYSKYLLGEITREELYSMIPAELLDSVICKAMSPITMPEIFEEIA